MNSCKNTSKKASNIHNFKGIYFNNEPEEKTLDLSTGAHFKYIDMYNRLQVVTDIRKSEERAKQSSFPIWSTVDKRSRSIEDSFDYSWIKQNSLLSRLPIQISNNHKTNNSHSDKLNNFMEAQSRRHKFWRNLDQQFMTNKMNQSIEDRRESIALNKILSKLRKDNGSVDALKQRIEDNTNFYGSKNYNKKQLRRDIYLYIEFKIYLINKDIIYIFNI